MLSWVLLTDCFEGLEGLFYVPGHADLGGEDVPHHPLLVYDVRVTRPGKSPRVLSTP